jgi:hypothetical protein
VIDAIGSNPDEVWVAQTDVVSFFDFIKHEVLLPDLIELGVPRELVDALRAMLRTWTSTPNTGIPQGPDASRVLANFYMVPIDREIAADNTIAYFRYMDDIRIVARHRSDLIRALQLLDTECRRRGLALSTKKTEITRGKAAVRSFKDRKLDAIQYAWNSPRRNPVRLRARLRAIFIAAIKKDGEIDQRPAKFALTRLRAARDAKLLPHVLANLDSLVPLGWMVPAYLLPWMHVPDVQRALSDYLRDGERNLSSYFSTWLLAGMLSTPGALPSEWVKYARVRATDRDEPAFHRVIAINVLALGRRERDIQRIEEFIVREHEPEIVRGALVALARVGRLHKPIVERVERKMPELLPTLKYLQGRRRLPDLIMSANETETPQDGKVP